MRPLTPARRLAQRRPYGFRGLGAGPDLASVVSSVARGVATGGAVRSITIRSNISPDITIDPRAYDENGQPLPGQQRSGQFAEALLKFSKLEIDVDTPAGMIRVAPYGRPETNIFWPVVILGVCGGVALAILVTRQLKG